MKIIRASSLAAALLLAAPLHAQVCSGGTDGGTDATGNQCNDPGAMASRVVPVDAGSRPPASASAGSGQRRAGGANVVVAAKSTAAPAGRSAGSSALAVDGGHAALTAYTPRR